jgi:hypothetical protein
MSTLKKSATSKSATAKKSIATTPPAPVERVPVLRLSDVMTAEREAQDFAEEARSELIGARSDLLELLTDSTPRSKREIEALESIARHTWHALRMVDVIWDQTQRGWDADAEIELPAKAVSK